MTPERIPNKSVETGDIGGNGCAVRRRAFLTEKVCRRTTPSSCDIRGIREAIVSAVDFDPKEAGVDDHRGDRDQRCPRKRGIATERREEAEAGEKERDGGRERTKTRVSMANTHTRECVRAISCDGVGIATQAGRAPLVARDDWSTLRVCSSLQ